MATSLPVFQPRARGRIEPANIDHLRELSQAQHGNILRSLRDDVPVPAAYDCRTQTPAFVPELESTDDDQAQCGSCWCFSGTEVVEAALIKAGILQIGQRLSKEYTLDCGKNGGCNGDDNTTVLDWAKATGLPLSADYGPYTAGGGRTGRCKFTAGMKLYKIDSWGFADSNGGQGVTSTDDIKRAILAYGMVGSAVAAGPDWDGLGPTDVISGRSRSIDHDVALVGWDDSKGAWIMKNSWGPTWMNGGYAWIKYGADSIGTETVFAVVKGPTPPPFPQVLDWAQL
jgi:C1A family cysteine protease